jgi:RecJ-like exonuclease
MKQTLKQIKEQKDTNTEYSLVLELKQIYRTQDGLNIFTVSDGETSLKLTKYDKNQVPYPNLAEGDIKEFTFKPKIFQNNVQADIFNVVDISSQRIEEFTAAKNSQEENKFKPKDETLLITSKTFQDMKPSMLKAATQIRKAVINKRPIHITHHGDCDGFSAGILLEQSIQQLIQQYHPSEKYLRQYISRNPSKPPYYDMVDATKDIGFFLSNSKRFGVSSPLIIIVDNGSTKQDLQSIQKVQLYGADVMVIDHHDPGAFDEEGKSIICKHTIAHVNPHLVGRTNGLSASMLCYQVAHYVNSDDAPNILTAAAGGVADRCDEEEIQTLISQTKHDREYFWKLAMIVDYEIYMTKMNLQAGGIHTLLSGEEDKRNALIDLYQPLIDEEKKQVIESLKKYVDIQTWGNHKVALVNGEDLTLWGDYFTIGKLAGITYDEFLPSIVIVHTPSMMVFRAQQESEFNVNILLSNLKEHITYARINGGGHAVAGSIKFLAAAKKDILEFIKQSVESK